MISSAEAHHITDVMRKKCGDRISVFDGTGNEYDAEILEIPEMNGKKSVVLRIIRSKRSAKEATVQIVLYQALLKSDKMDFVIQKCTETGVYKIVPVITERTVTVLNPVKRKERKNRWQRIAQSAAKQCGRGIIPEIGDVIEFREAIRMSSGSVELILAATERERHIRDYLKGDFSRISLFVGSEGGFTHDELDEAAKAGILSVSLGEMILRAETAGLIASATVLYEKGDLG